MSLTARRIDSLTEKTTLTDTDLVVVGNSSASYRLDKMTKLNFQNQVVTGFVKADGTIPFTGDQSMGGNKLTSLGNPILGTDAVNKDYADGLVGTTTGWTASAASFTYGGPQTIVATGVDYFTDYVLYSMDKIGLLNNGVYRSFYIKDVSLSAGDTVINLAGEIDLVAGTITNVSYSHVERPEGFKDGKSTYVCRAYTATPTTLVHSVFSKVTLAAVLDPFGMFSASTITIPVSGYYLVSYGSSVVVNTASGGIDFMTSISTNGVVSQYGTRVAFTLASLSTGILYSNGSTVRYFTKGDYLEVFDYLSDGAATNRDTDQSYMDVQFLHA